MSKKNLDFITNYEIHLIKYGFEKPYHNTTLDQRRADYLELMNDYIKAGEILEKIFQAKDKEE